MTCAFSARLKEIRNGHRYFIKKKKDGKEHVSRVADFGIGMEHHVLLEGITYPPEMASSMAQSLGGLTNAIKLCNENRTSMYSEKWRAAFTRAFSHIKECPEICAA